MFATNIWTYELNNSTLIIDSNWGLNYLSINLVSGTGTIQGNFSVGGLLTPLNLTIGQPFNIQSGNGANPIGDITITTTGVINIAGQR